MQQPPYPIPKGAEPYMELADPDPAFVATRGVFAWQQAVIEDLKTKGVFIVKIEGSNIFHGYYFPPQTSPKSCLPLRDITS
jgi:hypothetical protein